MAISAPASKAQRSSEVDRNIQNSDWNIKFFFFLKTRPFVGNGKMDHGMGEMIQNEDCVRVSLE